MDLRGRRQGFVKPIFFPATPDLRKWFTENHPSAAELWVGYYKRGSGIPSVTWPESVDEALCVGWIDGVRRSLDGARYMIRSIWSTINREAAVGAARAMGATRAARDPGRGHLQAATIPGRAAGRRDPAPGEAVPRGASRLRAAVPGVARPARLDARPAARVTATMEPARIEFAHT